tara:strand:- start:437 stop:1258 length:822 start_codon:yes stop_codon:yes gene_type:complete
MAIQYSLNYDDQGNPSLVKNTVTGSRKVIDTSGFTIGAYIPRRTVSVDYTFIPTEDSREVFGTQTQYEILQTYIKENDGGDDTTTVTPEDFNLSIDEQTKVNNLKAAGMFKEAEDFEKYSINQAKAKSLKTATNLFSFFTPSAMISSLGASAKIYDTYADKSITNIMDNYYASEYYKDKVTKHDYEYQAYTGYDVYNDYDEFLTTTDYQGETYSTAKGTGNVEGGLGTETMADIQSRERGQSLHGGNGGGSNQGGVEGSVSRGGTDDTPGTPF